MRREIMKLKKGSLWESLVKTTDQAVSAGALLPIPTDYFFIEDRGVRFFVRVLANLSRKDEARRKQESESKSGRSVNPFLPPERELTVADVSETHIAVLNKYNVMEHHLLIVTRHFEDQDTLLTPQDFEALCLCMAEYNALGFYNGGRDAGASQQHKHLQMVPLPLAPTGPEIPIEPLLSPLPTGGIGTVPGFTFLHSFARLDPDLVTKPGKAAQTTFELYAGMLKGLGMASPSASGTTLQSGPYCLLVTRQWMLLVPRSREYFEDISFNSLSFAGSLFVRNDLQFKRLKSYGPMNALGAVTLPAAS
jgi:ATP adenylyltransferase